MPSSHTSSPYNVFTSCVSLIADGNEHRPVDEEKNNEILLLGTALLSPECTEVTCLYWTCSALSPLLIVPSLPLCVQALRRAMTCSPQQSMGGRDTRLEPICRGAHGGIGVPELQGLHRRMTAGSRDVSPTAS